MKKHLTQPPPSFKSVGVEVSPKLEAAVFHALEKEVEARTPTVEAFLAELRAAVEEGGTTMQSVRNTLGGQLGDTLFAPPSHTTPPPATETPFDSMAGTVSSASLTAEEQAKIAASRAQHEFEQQERDRIAREELEREAEARRKAAQEAERKKKEEAERVAREKAEREERERQQREQIERVERQAKELEDRLARLATSMPPAPGTVDPESTQIHQGLKTASISRASLAEPAPVVPDPAISMGASIAPKPKSNLPILLGAAFLVLLLVGGGAAFFLLKPGSAVDPDPPVTTSPQPNDSPTPLPKAQLIEIPGGTFKMGRNNGPADLSEAPEHTVTVNSFFMDRTEVTNAEYAEFVRETNRPWPEHWASPKAPAGEELLPVSNVTQDDAVDFAAWRSKRDGVTYRLPTEEEWEYAARNGDRSDLYPWGNEWKTNGAVLNEPTAAPVGSRPEGKNRWGVEDLIGNVWEWTSSKLQAYPGSLGTIPPNRRDWVTFRGAGYPMNPADREYPVSSCVRSARPANFKARQLGFRLVRSA